LTRIDIRQNFTLNINKLVIDGIGNEDMRRSVIMPPMQQRQLTPVDRLLAGVDCFLKTVTAGSTHGIRENPAREVEDKELSASERSHAAGLMRVNHAGEIAAQGLYQGHAAVARNPEIEEQMQRAADEERDHLAWCEERLKELGAGPSRLSPVWYGGAFAIGAASGILGDRWSLGFIEETEHQVVQHLTGHLDRLPADDAKSRAIVHQMRDEEALHGANAKKAGAAELPIRIRRMMRLAAKIMTGTAYWL
jgi:ubiquinone biosynthesis monooxygenase Coq7